MEDSTSVSNNANFYKELNQSYDLSIAETIYYYNKKFGFGRTASIVTLGLISLTGVGGVILLTNHLWKMAMSNSFESLVNQCILEEETCATRSPERLYKMKSLDRLVERLCRICLRIDASDDQEKQLADVACHMIRAKKIQKGISSNPSEIEGVLKEKFHSEIGEYNGYMFRPFNKL
ncbi:MAG: hypothetical protein WA347_05430 [Rhabdochlamydiaceae bacterium]|jgi:hypothetical protein